jgi:hypothetical protein
MWARVIEFMLACWLAISPFVFEHPAHATILWANDLTCAILIATFSLACYHRRLKRAHLLNLPLALWLLSVGFMNVKSATTCAAQNHMVVALLLAILAIVPSRSAKPPQTWVDFVESPSH